MNEQDIISSLDDIKKAIENGYTFEIYQMLDAMYVDIRRIANALEKIAGGKSSGNTCSDPGRKRHREELQH